MEESTAESNASPMLQIHRRTVYKHQERYRREGLSAFETHKPGIKPGPRLMSSEEEKALL